MSYCILFVNTANFSCELIKQRLPQVPEKCEESTQVLDLNQVHAY